MQLAKAYRIETERLVIRCYQPKDGILLKNAIDESLDHLRPWMPWAHNEPEKLADKIARLRKYRGQFDLGVDYVYGMIDVGVVVGFSLTGDYYFVEDRVIRPFVGFGIGRYGGATVIANTNDDEVDEDDIITGAAFGVSPRVGIELSHLRIALEYNLTFNDQVPSYIGLSLSPTLWGGLKKKNR